MPATSAFEEYLTQVDEHLEHHFVDTGVLEWWLGLRESVIRAHRRDARNQVWEQCLAGLPELPGISFGHDGGVGLRPAAALSVVTRNTLTASLRALRPWRKGPFDFCGVTVDAEWRSDWKWQRVRPHLATLNDRRVLDVGCGNGYYAWCMLGAGARVVVGLDPAWLALAQFRALQRYLPRLPVSVLPLGSEALDRDLQAFDTVFSMGVLYHRRDPADHLRELRRALRPGGQLVLETLVIDSSDDDALIPQGRYARMRNVWSVPSPSRVIAMLTAAGFAGPHLVDLCRTTVAEQRATTWMQFQSLADFLDPADHSRTVEGYPAPLRAVFIAAAA